MSDWGSVDRDIVDAVEPLLQDIVRSARAGAIPQEAGELKVVILEKYEWDANARSVTSCKCLLEIPNFVSNTSPCQCLAMFLLF